MSNTSHISQTPALSLTNDSPTSDLTHWLRNQDFSAIREQLHRYRPFLRRIVSEFDSPKLRRKVDQSDIVQDVLHDAVRGLPSVKAQSSREFLSWLRTLLENRMRGVTRHFVGTAKRSVNREVYDENSAAAQSPWVSNTATPDEELIELEQLQYVMRAIQRMPEELQALLRWRFEDSLSYSEIGERVQRSPDAVRMLINRCLRRIESECSSLGSREQR